MKVDTLLKADQMQNVKLRDQVLDLVGISPKRMRESDQEKMQAVQQEAMKARMMAEANNVPEPAVNPINPVQ